MAHTASAMKAASAINSLMGIISPSHRTPLGECSQFATFPRPNPVEFLQFGRKDSRVPASGADPIPLSQGPAPHRLDSSGFGSY